MQWLIDIVKEWIQAQGYALQSWVLAKGYLTTSFVDRGDPVAPDLFHPLLTTDGAWHDLNLSGVIPAGAKAVLLQLSVEDDAVRSLLSLRKKGNVQSVNVGSLITIVANIPIRSDVIVPLDENRFIQYFFTNTTWNDYWITVKGWWL